MNDEITLRVWVRAVFRLDSGREITRTVRWEASGDPDDAERIAIILYELTEELNEKGQDFPEGHGILITVLGTAHG